MPIRWRLTIGIVIATTFLVVTAGLLFESNLSSAIQATLKRSLQRRQHRVEFQLISRQLILSTAPIVLTQDQSVVQVIDPTHKLQYSTARAGSKPILNVSQLKIAQNRSLWFEYKRAGWLNKYLIFASSFKISPSQQTTVLVGTSTDPLHDSLSQVRKDLLITEPIIIFLAGLGAWLLTGAVLRPVEQLRSEAKSIFIIDQDKRLAIPNTKDELADLARTFNELLGKVQATLGDQRRFVAAASHELRTPLAALKAELELAQKPNRSSKELTKAIDEVAIRVDDLIKLAQSLLLLAQSDEAMLKLSKTSLDLVPLIVASLGSQKAKAQQLKIEFVLHADPELIVCVDAIRLRQVMDNLVDNALNFSPIGSLVEVSVQKVANNAIVEVKDMGAGFSPEILDQVFERFTRTSTLTNRKGNGFGLGLSIVKMIVENHKGSIELGNNRSQGAFVRVILPIGQ